MKTPFKNYQNTILIALAACAASPTAWAKSDVVGSGGGAFICANQNDSEFLDLFEAKIPGLVTKSGLSISPSSASVHDQIMKAFARLKVGSDLYKKMLEVYDEVKAAKQDVTPAGASIAWPADEKNQLTKTDCKPMGIILFDDQKQSMQIDLNNLEALPPQQQAAAWVHETVYKFMRETVGDTDSVRSRKVVGHLFSNESDAELASGLLEVASLNINPSNSIDCSDDASQGGETCVYPISYPGQPVTLTFHYVEDRNNDLRCGAMTAPLQQTVWDDVIAEQPERFAPIPLDTATLIYKKNKPNTSQVYSFDWATPFFIKKGKSGLFGLHSEKVSCKGSLYMTDSEGRTNSQPVRTLGFLIKF